MRQRSFDDLHHTARGQAYRKHSDASGADPDIVTLGAEKDTNMCQAHYPWPAREASAMQADTRSRTRPARKDCSIRSLVLYIGLLKLVCQDYFCYT